MNRARTGMLTLLLVGCAGVSLGAPPVAPSYQGVMDTIGTIRSNLAPGGQESPNAPGWNLIVDAIERELQAYTGAGTEADHRAALDRLNQIAAALGASAWPPAIDLRNQLLSWIQPRLTLSAIAQGLEQSVQRLPATSDPATQGNRQRWVDFVENELGAAIRAYEAAPDTAARQAARDQIAHALGTLRQVNAASVWYPSLQLHGALAGIFDRPNLEATADLPTVSPYLNQPVAITGQIARRGQVSQVTAGPKTGFALLPSDNGIAFYNSQMVTSYTPIRGFHEQVAADPQGQRAARLYCFCAATQDNSEMRVWAEIRTTGLELMMDPTHNIQFFVNAVPTAGRGLVRGIAGLIGYTRERIIQEVHDQAYPRVVQEMIQGAREEIAERGAANRAQQNAKLARALIGNNTIAVGPAAIVGASLRSRPEYVYVGGTLVWRGLADQRGADAPKPPQFAAIAPGVTADVHLPSLLTNVSKGAFQDPRVQGANNIMIVSRPGPGGAPSAQTSQNVDYPTFLRQVDAVQATNDPKAIAVRVKRPSQAPDFSVDRNGRLVVLVHDLQADLPTPKGQNVPGAAPDTRVLRLESQLAQVAISFHYNPPAVTPTGWTQARITGRVEEFDPGPSGRLLAIGEDESQATPLNPLTGAIALSVVRSKLQGQPIDVPLDTSRLPAGVQIRSISDLDRSGWMRANLAISGPIAKPSPYAQPAPPAQVVQAAPATQPLVYMQPAPATSQPVMYTQPAPASQPVAYTQPSYVAAATTPVYYNYNVQYARPATMVWSR